VKSKKPGKKNTATKPQNKYNIPQIRWRRIGNKYLVSNDFGRYVILGEMDFKKLLDNKITEKDKNYQLFVSNGFIKNNMDFGELWLSWQKLNSYIFQGPSLHILVLTLRCNYRCIYCQSSAMTENAKNKDMSWGTARKSIDTAFKSNVKNLSIEFQGGEPLLNWDVLKKSISYIKNLEKKSGKKANIALVSNFSLMDEEKAKFLMENEVSLCTSLDGFDSLNNKLRIYPKGNSYKEAVKWIKYLTDKYNSQHGNMFKIFKPSALTTITKETLPFYKEIVDEYVNLNLENIFLRPLSPIGFARRCWNKIGYSSDEFLKFYEKAFDYIISLNKKGIFVREKMAEMLLKKIIKNEDPGYVDLRCPCGAGIGQLAYNYNGDVYTCDEGRMIGWEGEELFKIGNIKNMSYEDIVKSDTVKLCSLSSNLESQVMCHKCVYRPYCGICPAINFEETASTVGNNIVSERCKIFMGIFDIIFKRITKKDYYDVFNKWLEYEEKTKGEK
jgi:His-Xaa-Ser system radical SAM maturase HxsB